MTDVTTVTSENAQEFYATRLPQRQEPPADDPAKAEKDDKSTEPKADSESKPHDKPRKPLQPRINELVAERNAARDETEAERLLRENAERERDDTRRELDEIKRKLQILEAPPAPVPQSDRPTRSQFATDDDFNEALSDWKADQRLAEQQKRDAEARQKAALAQLDENWNDRLAQARTQFEDYDTVVGGADIELPEVVLGAIKESEVGAQLAYQLAKDGSKEAKRLRALSVTAQLRELGKLEAALVTAKPDVKDEGKGKSVSAEKSKAPEPIEPLKGKSVPIGKDTKGMTYDEWKAARKAGHIK